MSNCIVSDGNNLMITNYLFQLNHSEDVKIFQWFLITIKIIFTLLILLRPHIVINV